VDTLGWVYYRQDRLKDAEPTLQQAVELTAERHPDVLVHLAQVRYDRGQDQAASDLVDKALKLNPEFGPALQLQKLLRGGPRPPGEIG
ncbi:MAG: hypothetical protein IT340_02065, partial [Chloroflexi bacterium]|nr:hypothetical protein [Chloroflexota bacterium]